MPFSLSNFVGSFDVNIARFEVDLLHLSSYSTSPSYFFYTVVNEFKCRLIAFVCIRIILLVTIRLHIQTNVSYIIDTCVIISLITLQENQVNSRFFICVRTSLLTIVKVIFKLAIKRMTVFNRLETIYNY